MTDRAQQRLLKQQYREAPPAAGVFTIRNLASGRLLLGASLNLEGSLNRHRFELGMRGHRNRDLQADWLAQGAEGFAFDVVDTVKERPADPAFDREAELEVLHELWSQEFARRGAPRYDSR